MWIFGLMYIVVGSLFSGIIHDVIHERARMYDEPMISVIFIGILWPATMPYWIARSICASNAKP